MPSSFPAPTPMMAQYLEIKTANPDSLLFYRMGDFFELFFEDAVQASAALGIALTKRGTHHGKDIPMCGVPVHAAQEYLSKLIEMGYKVAICEQTETPAEAKKRGHKAVVRREVVRLVTAGTLTEDHLLTANQNNYLAALAKVRHEEAFALAWVDISTGDLKVTSCTLDALGAELASCDPKELLLPDDLAFDGAISESITHSARVLTPLPAARFDSASGQARLKAHFHLETFEALGNFTRGEFAALGALLDYISLTQVGALPQLSLPEKRLISDVMVIDQATRTNLELVKTFSGQRQGSLLWAIDRTITAAGGRLLGQWLSAPLADLAPLSERLDAIDFLVTSTDIRQKSQSFLKNSPDLGRALSRLTLGRGGPRDLATVHSALCQAFDLGELFSKTTLEKGTPMPVRLETLRKVLCHGLGDLCDLLDTALLPSLPLHARDGGFVQPGFSKELDDLKKLRDESRSVIASLEHKYAEHTGIKSLKIKHNNVLGYFVEVTQTHLERMGTAPFDTLFHHRQTTANLTRFSTSELLELEQKSVRAADQALALEGEIFERLVRDVCDHSRTLMEIAKALATLDVLIGLSALAVEERWVRPMVEESLAFEIEEGRHPVVERALRKASSEAFIPNDCTLTGNAEEGGALWLITGPNMAGKSTFLRQNALIAILAQMGSYVPASRARLGICDRLFSRVGAADDLARGRSTFMVEMVETATILTQATKRSLVILDEIGRGTATFDGLSIAWSCVEHLHTHIGSRALFATHFHELTALEKTLKRLKTVTLEVKEWEGEVIFLHRVGPGKAHRSYGIEVGRLAGLPKPVLVRAEQIMALLEQSGPTPHHRGEALLDLPLFASKINLEKAPPPAPIVLEKTPEEKATLALLRDINPDECTGKMALDTLYTLKNTLENKGKTTE